MADLSDLLGDVYGPACAPVTSTADPAPAPATPAPATPAPATPAPLTSIADELASALSAALAAPTAAPVAPVAAPGIDVERSEIAERIDATDVLVPPVAAASPVVPRPHVHASAPVAPSPSRVFAAAAVPTEEPRRIAPTATWHPRDDDILPAASPPRRWGRRRSR